MAIVTGDQYLESLVKFVENEAERLIEGTVVLKLNPVGLRYVESRLEALSEVESLLSGAPVDYLRAYVSDLGDHRALEQLRRILRLLPSLKVVSVLPSPARDPTPLYLLPFARLKLLELRGCDLSTSAAKGLLHLRFTLEKFICHNSTDALRHVFASRIAEIKDSPQWNRLSFVSCACNGLLLMDESLQLLPVVETLDLSRNKFANANNLSKSTKLKHLDLGFNSLRSIASLNEVSCQIVKLVLRNNALTTLRGVENMKSLEGLDLSYNIISNFSEVEVLAGLPSLQNLWLEGNPICYARWFRAQVFSLFSHPERLELDEKRISASEFWKRQIIVASRQNQPASFGFYSPLRDHADLQGSINTKRKRISRLVSIESEDSRTCLCSDQDSVSCDNEIHSKDENVDTDDEAEIEEIMKRIEFMKKERSVLWLQEFKEWMNQPADNVADGSKFRSCILSNNKEIHMKNKAEDENLGETSRYISDSIPLSGDESSTIILESETSFADASTVVSGQRYFDQIGDAASKRFMGHTGGDISVAKKMDASREEPGILNNAGHVYAGADSGDSCYNSLAVPSGNNVSTKNVIFLTAAINDIRGSCSSVCPGSPPHYKDDILHRRHYMEEELLQLSAESFSVASSDSNTSCSEDESAEFGSSVAQIDQFAIDNLSRSSAKSFIVDSYQDDITDEYHDNILSVKQNGTRHSAPAEGNFASIEVEESEISTHACSSSFIDGTVSFSSEETVWLEKNKRSRKPRRRMISLPEEDDAHGDNDSSKKSGDHVEILESDLERERKEICCANNLWTSSIPTENNGDSAPHIAKCCGGSCYWFRTLSDGKDDFIEAFFNLNVADSGVNEVSTQYIQCNCLFLEKSGYIEREVAILRSSEQKLYILLIFHERDESGTSLEMVDCHRADNLREVFVGLGLLFLRVYFEGNTTYLFITRCLERSSELLRVLDIIDSSGTKDYCSLISLEQIQINFLEEYVFGGSKINIFQYSMVLFWHNILKEDLWLSRSVFVLEGHLLVCSEDVVQFGPTENSFSPCYFSMGSCCAIGNVFEMVIDTSEDMCVTLTFECTSAVIDENACLKNNQASDQPMWKLKWFSRESLLKFVALVKAIHAKATSSTLVVTYKS